MKGESVSVVEANEPPIRLAVITFGISHFEVPLFRLIHRRRDVSMKVFYIRPVKQGVFDTEYSQEIEWGGDLLAGYESCLNPKFSGIMAAVADWAPDVSMIYGYSWPGIVPYIIRNWLGRHPQVHRGTLNYHDDPRHRLTGRFFRPVSRFLLSRFDAHHFGGSYSRKVLVEAGAREASMFFVPFSVDTPFFSHESENPSVRMVADSLRQQLGWGADCFVVLFIAQHNWFKGPDIAMESFVRLARRHPRMRFLIVGAGRETAAMKAVAEAQIPEGRVHFAGFIPSLDTPPFYLASDLVLCSSRYETWGRMLNEAMLCRCPAVVSQIVPAAGDLVVDGVTGHVVGRPEVDLFTEAVDRHFAMDRDTRSQMGDAARNRALELAYEPWLDNVVAAARYALDRRKRK